jgi:hypothetical protein
MPSQLFAGDHARKDGVVLTATGIEIPTGLAAGSYPEGSVNNVEGKVAFVSLNNQFSRNQCPLPDPTKLLQGNRTPRAQQLRSKRPGRRHYFAASFSTLATPVRAESPPQVNHPVLFGSPVSWQITLPSIVLV